MASVVVKEKTMSSYRLTRARESLERATVSYRRAGAARASDKNAEKFKRATTRLGNAAMRFAYFLEVEARR